MFTCVVKGTFTGMGMPSSLFLHKGVKIEPAVCVSVCVFACLCTHVLIIFTHQNVFMVYNLMPL